MTQLYGLGDEPRGAWLTPLTSGRARLFAMLLLALLMLSVQSVFAARPALRTDVGTLIIVFLALEFDPLRGAVNALFVGYLVDVFAGGPRGISAAAMVVVFVVIRLLVVRVTGARFLMVTAVSVLGTLLALLTRVLIEALVGPDLVDPRNAWPGVPAALTGAVLLGYPCYRLLSGVDRRFRPREEGTVLLSLTPRR